MSTEKKRGGVRPGAGRPKSEPTKVVRIPVRLLEKFYTWLKTEMEKKDG